MSNSEIKTNRINIYLIKSKYSNEDSITKISEDPDISRVTLDGVGILYFKKSTISIPEWLSTFFNNHPSIDQSNFTASSSRAVLISKIKFRGKDRFFAIPFGSGRFLLKDLSYEDRYGLITTLNILEAKSIRGIDKRTLTTNPKSSREQIAKASEAIDFQIDFERDLIRAITGKSVNADFGNLVTGKEALSVAPKVDITNLHDFLRKTLSTYEKKDYQKNFSWIDQIKEVKNQETIDKLDRDLLKMVLVKKTNVWLAIPDIIEFSTIKGFKYSSGKKASLYEELNLEDFLEEYTATISTVDDLQNASIYAWSATEDDYEKRWTVYGCLNAEIDLKKKTYLLSNGKWFEISEEFVSSVNDDFKKVQQVDIKMPDYNHKDEKEYNEAASKVLKGLCLDAKNISYGGGHSKIEVCDILTNDKKLIHVKKYGGSAVLSHLFAQGAVSAELILVDEDFRKKIIDTLLTPSFKTTIPESKPDATTYSIYYGIITTQKKPTLSIPFFSKVVLKNVRRILNGFGYELYLTKISNVKVDEVDKDT